MESHLLQMRGLKLNTVCVNLGTVVASFTDAWIETQKCWIRSQPGIRRIFYRCVD